MSIAFKCPNCQQPYKVKDDMAGKRVVCTACKQPIRVPAPTPAAAVPAADADALAVAALAEAPAAPAEQAAATITVECPNCIEQVTFPADKAGKQAPCPSCKRVIKVPIPATGKKDWRTADARPTFAKVVPEADLKGVVSTANMKIVDREALLEAGAIRKREREPLPMAVKVRWGIVVGLAALAAATGVWMFRGKKVAQRRDDLVRQALELVKPDILAVGVRAETFRAAGEYVLSLPDGQAAAARDHLSNARNVLSANDAKTTEQPFEKTALLTRIVVSQTGLVGDREQTRAGTRMDWPATLKELRYSLAALKKDRAQQWEGSILAIRRLTQRLGVRGATPQQPAILGLVMSQFDSQPERADAIAAVGLELFGAGEAGQAKAKELAKEVQDVGEAAGSARVVALLIATGLADQPKTENPLVGIRVGAAEGFARRGDLEAARKIADLPGGPEDRFQALVAIAAVQMEGPDLSKAVEFFASEFKNRDLPDWPLIQLSQICAEAKAPDPVKKLNAALAEFGNLSPRSQAVRAWAQMELLRSPLAPATDESLKAIVPEASLGRLLAWEVLARRTASADGAPASARPLALVGAALGSMK